MSISFRSSSPFIYLIVIEKMLSNALNTADIFSPETQDEFWGSMNPDAREFLDRYEVEENWTYCFEELPELFIKLATALPRIVEIPPSTRSTGILHGLIAVLANMPFRQSMFALAWLDQDIDQAKQEEDKGWGVMCFLEAADLCLQDPNSELALDAKTIYERVQTLLKTRLTVSLFTDSVTL